MTERIEYHVAKAKSYVKSHKNGITNLDLAVRLGMNTATWFKFKTILNDVPEIYYDKSIKKWMWTG